MKPYNSGDVKEALFAISLVLQRVHSKLPTIQEVEDFIDNELHEDCSTEITCISYIKDYK